ncbi:MAG: nucleotidyltransferase domain-containing protein [Defluviitaleaceae bacterium]|nr:nucleotidyltransferase domain-containing protein [Defluviitaleaceae bacterium]
MLTTNEIIEKLRPVFESSGVIKAILFGSYASGCATAGSDVDIVVECEDHIRGWGFCEIAESIYQCLEIKVDLISYGEIIPNGRLDNEVAATGMVIYDRSR